MNKYKYGLIIGRFQPPCNHHIEFIKEVISSGIQELLVAIGQSPELDSRNFLPATEVKSLMVTILDTLDFPYKIFIVPDINNPPLYANHVQKLIPIINEKNTCLFTENKYTSDCFINYGHNFKVIVPKIIDSRATIVRQMLNDNDQTWQTLVPQNVAKFIKNKK